MGSLQERWASAMGTALHQARCAVQTGDVPVGAVVLDEQGALLARGRNAREAFGDPTAHAEVLALRAAAAERGEWRLDGCTLVVTLEPCVMCAGALSLSRIDRIVFGTTDPKAGATGSLYKIHDDARLNHKIELVAGICETECRQILVDFFRAKRAK